MKNHDLQFILCPSKFSADLHLYEKIYHFWHKTWSTTFQELENSSNLSSDSFSRQDWVAAIFMDGECVAVSTFRYFDLHSSVSLSDSYFANWSPEALKQLRSQGRMALACCFFGIAPHLRSGTLGFSMKDLLMGFVTEVFAWSAADCMTGAVRKCKNVHGSAYSWGAQCVAQDVPSGHGPALVDLVTFSHGEVAAKKKVHKLTPWIDLLWSRLIIAEKIERPLVLTTNSQVFELARAS